MTAMTPHPNQKVQDVSEIVAEHMDAILACFKPGAKIIVLIRRPEKPDGSQDFILTNDTIDAAITALQTRKTAPTVEGAV